MSYGVIVCPHCHNVKGADLSCKTTKCIQCGKRLTIKTLQPQYVTDDQQTLALAVREVTTRLKGGRDSYQQALTEYQQVPQPKPLKTSVDDEPLIENTSSNSQITPSRIKDQLLTILKALTDREGTFDLKTFEKALKAHGLPYQRSVEYIDTLQAEGLVYEPRLGRYRLI